MSVLSAQSIRRLCINTERPLISPFVERGVIRGRSFGLSTCTYDCRISNDLIIPIGESRLASTLERFIFPANVCGSILDKSTWARNFVSAFNTHFDPNFEGYATIELVNLGTKDVIFEVGDPLVQMKFEMLDEPTDILYNGKYQFQGPAPEGPRYE